MEQLYLIPDRTDMEQSAVLINECGGNFEYNDFWKPEVLDDTKQQEEIISYYAKYRTDFSKDTMHGAFLDINICSSDPLIREISVKRIYQSMDIAKRMGLRAVVFHTGLIAGLRVSEYLENWVVESAHFYEKLAEQYPSQEILIENMFDESPYMLAKLADHLKGIKNLGVCLDYAHGALTGCANDEWIKVLAPYIRHMHLNDNDLERDLHKAVGTGNIDWWQFNNKITECGIKPTVLIEVKGAEAQRKSLEYMKKNHIYPFTNREV